MYTITMLDNDNGCSASVEDFDSLEDFKNALRNYGAEYDGSNDVVLIW